MDARGRPTAARIRLDPIDGQGRGLVPGPMRWERELPRGPSAKVVSIHFGTFGEGLVAAGRRRADGGPSCRWPRLHLSVFSP